jgi:ubiquinone/menaquinone biosynthesis C-methylase UbiE
MSDEDREKEEGIVGVFSRSASTFDRGGPRIFSHFGQRLVDLAQIAPGADVLDVAAGRGAVLFPAARQVGPHGRVVRIDLSTDMVRETTAEMQSFGWQHAAMHQMDAEQLDFPDASFDWVLCGFALWFFPQPYRALTEFFRVLRPGGGIGITTWVEDCPFLHLCREVFRPYLPPASPAEQGSEEGPQI